MAAIANATEAAKRLKRQLTCYWLGQDAKVHESLWHVQPWLQGSV
jgi:hypothetical protein